MFAGIFVLTLGEKQKLKTDKLGIVNGGFKTDKRIYEIPGK